MPISRLLFCAVFFAGFWMLPGGGVASAQVCQLYPNDVAFLNYKVDNNPTDQRSSVQFGCNSSAQPMIGCMVVDPSTLYMTSTGGGRNAIVDRIDLQLGEGYNGTNLVPLSRLNLGLAGGPIGPVRGPGNTSFYLRIAPNSVLQAGHYEGHITAILQYRPNDGLGCGSGAPIGKTTTQSIPVSLTALFSCTATIPTSVDLGQFQSLVSGAQVQSEISANCFPGTVYSVSIDNGKNAAGGRQRFLALNGNTIPYNIDTKLFSVLNWTPWPTANGNSYPWVGDGLTQRFQLRFRVDPTTLIYPSGKYTDTLTVNVTY